MRALRAPVSPLLRRKRADGAEEAIGIHGTSLQLVVGMTASRQSSVALVLSVRTPRCTVRVLLVGRRLVVHRQRARPAWGCVSGTIL